MRNFKTAAGILAASSMLALGAAGTAGASTATVKPNATAACGFSCSNLFSEQLGSHTIQWAYIPGSNGVAITAKQGDKVILKLGSDSATNADYVLSQDDTLGDACPAFNQTQPALLPYNSFACIQFREGNFDGSFPVIESNWAPDGNASGLCPGVATAHVAGEAVTLQPCGASANTLFVIDTNDAHVIGGIVYAPAILGSDSNTSQPLVLTLSTGSKNPANQLSVQRLLLLDHGFVPNDQEWSFQNGPAL